MKLILVSAESSVFRKPVFKALRDLGVEVRCFDDRGSSFVKPGHILQKFMKLSPSPMRTAIEHFARRSIDRALMRTVAAERPDAVFFLKAKSIGIDVLDKLRKITTTLNWYPDAMNNWPSIRRLAPHYDLFFTFDRAIVRALRDAGLNNVHHLPFCGDVGKQEEWPHADSYHSAVTFLGSYHPADYRQRLAILMRIKDLGLQVWGNREWMNTPLRDCYRGPVTPDVSEIRRIYAASNIVIHSDANASNPHATGLTMRPFDVTAAGALLVAQDDRPEIDDMFSKGREYVSFHDELDVREKVDYYANHREARDEIARAGFYRTRSEHTYLDRMEAVLHTINETTTTKAV
jgi:spore maturation protein CgeB